MSYLKCDYDRSKLASEQKRLHVETDHVIIEYGLFSVILIKIKLGDAVAAVVCERAQRDEFAIRGFQLR